MELLSTQCAHHTLLLPDPLFAFFLGGRWSGQPSGGFKATSLSVLPFVSKLKFHF